MAAAVAFALAAAATYWATDRLLLWAGKVVTLERRVVKIEGALRIPQ